MEPGTRVIVRSRSASPFVGDLIEFDKKYLIATIANARRIYSWVGAATLSQLAQTGTSAPAECRWPGPVSEIILTMVDEILAVSPEAAETHNQVPIWSC